MLFRYRSRNTETQSRSSDVAYRICGIAASWHYGPMALRPVPETLGESLKLNILFSHLNVVLKKVAKKKRKTANIMAAPTTNYQHDQFDESRNFDLKLNEPARYEYRSLPFGTSSNSGDYSAQSLYDHFSLLQDDLLRCLQLVGP